MPDPTAAELIALVELEQQATRGEWGSMTSMVVTDSGVKVLDCLPGNGLLIATLRNWEPRRTVRELVRVADLSWEAHIVCESDALNEACGTCSPCTARAWIAEQLAKGCESAAFLGPEVPCGTCVPCVLEEMIDA